MDIVLFERFDKQLMRRAVFLASAPSRWATVVRWALALLIVVGTPVLLYDAMTGDEEISLTWLARRLFVLAIGLYYLLGPYVRQWRMAEKMWRTEQNSPITEGRITSQGISYGRGEAEVSYPWADFVRLREDKKLPLIVLITVKGVFVALARRFFDSDQDWERAQQLVRLKVVPAS